MDVNCYVSALHLLLHDFMMDYNNRNRIDCVQWYICDEICQNTKPKNPMRKRPKSIWECSLNQLRWVICCFETIFFIINRFFISFLELTFSYAQCISINKSKKMEKSKLFVQFCILIALMLPAIVCVHFIYYYQFVIRPKIHIFTETLILLWSHVVLFIGCQLMFYIYIQYSHILQIHIYQ